MNRKVIGILVILTGLIAIIGIVYIVFFYNFSKDKEPAVNTDISTPVDTTKAEKESSQIPPEKFGESDDGSSQPIVQRDIGQDDLKRMAGSFTERYGSYSNHSNYGNIIDLKIFMTKSMQAKTDRYVDEERSRASNQGAGSDIYYGITTKAISQEILEYDENLGRAVILVKTQRRESTGTMSNSSTFYQDVTLVFVKEDEAWKVNNSTWGDK